MAAADVEILTGVGITTVGNRVATLVAVIVGKGFDGMRVAVLVAVIVGKWFDGMRVAVLVAVAVGTILGGGHIGGMMEHSADWDPRSSSGGPGIPGSSPLALNVPW